VLYRIELKVSGSAVRAPDFGPTRSFGSFLAVRVVWVSSSEQYVLFSEPSQNAGLSGDKPAMRGDNLFKFHEFSCNYDPLPANPRYAH
ncbi:MAG: hypothetical protein ABW107_00560, partial [Candidatus Thiodiazotropha sp. 6PLUC5]